MNPYQYAYNNPLRYVDPSGKFAILTALGFVAVGGAAGAAGSILSQYLEYGNLNCINWGKVGKAALAGAAAVGVGIAVGWVIATAGATVFGSGLTASVLVGAVEGVVGGQYARLTANLILGDDPTEGMFQKDMLWDGALGGLGGAVGYGLAKLVKSLRVAKAMKAAAGSVDDVIIDGKYMVGEYQAIKGKPGLDAHHVGQKAGMELFIENYDPKTAPAINVPKVGHTIKGPNGIVSRSLEGITSARELLARNIVELLRVFDDIPDSAIIELIELNLKKYPEMRY